MEAGGWCAPASFHYLADHGPAPVGAARKASRSVVRVDPPPIALRRGAAALGLEPSAPSGTRHRGLLARFGLGECALDDLLEALERRLTVLVLTTSSRCHDAEHAVTVDPRREAAQQSLTLSVGQTRAHRHAPPHLDPRGRRVDVLASRPARARGPELEFLGGNRELHCHGRYVRMPKGVGARAGGGNSCLMP